MDNRQYSRILEEIALLKQLKGENVFKVRAYENAARAIGNLTESVEDVMDQGDLTDISGVGKSIAAEVEQIRQSGTSPTHTALLEELDPGLLDLMRIQGLGPKRIRVLFEELGITNVGALKEAASTGRVAELEGFGEKTQEKILHEIERLAEAGDRTPLPAARAIAVSIRDQLAALPEVERIAIAGSIRRGRETIGDIDLLIAAAEDEAQPIFQAFVDLPEIGEVLVRGDTKTSARLRTGQQVDVRIVRPDQFGAALHYFTGSKEHSVAMRTRAKRMGFRINEYGVTRLEDDAVVASRTEEELFAALDLAYIPPELREGHGEVEQAEISFGDGDEGGLPVLIELEDVRGDLHMHTTETDGRASIEEMAEAARALGYDYIVITDHSKAVRVANGMDAARFAAQIAQVRAADEAVEGITILAGIEVDILKDGSLDMDHDLLAECDWVVGSVHSHFNMESAQMTERLLRAIDTGLLSCLGHPTGRILGGRSGYTYDFDAVVAAAIERRVAFEMNGSTGRLDLNAEMAAIARARGASLVFGSDAHSTTGLGAMSYAVEQARRAGMTKDDVLNTRSASELLAAVRS